MKGNRTEKSLKMVKRKKFVKIDKKFEVDKMIDSLLKGSRTELAKAITLVESVRNEDRDVAKELLEKVLPSIGKSIRIGISGVPGAGKSTFIESFGMMLCELGYHVAVLAIDPSSARTGGSILGDKTRMEQLSSHPNAFIRPSPTSGTLGGVHQMTRESIMLCEAAGFDVIIVETVGVGQSETAVRNMVDFFMLLVLTGAGDDLQGMKKGIMEITDAIIVHKADGHNVRPAKRTVREYKLILHYLQRATPDWDSIVLPVSSLENSGHEEIWKVIGQFKEKMQQSGYWEIRRQEQNSSWFQEMIKQKVIDDFIYENNNKNEIIRLERQIQTGELSVSKAMDVLFNSKTK